MLDGKYKQQVLDSYETYLLLIDSLYFGIRETLHASTDKQKPAKRSRLNMIRLSWTRLCEMFLITHRQGKQTQSFSTMSTSS